MSTDLTQCCGRPPRLISKAGYGYSIVCMECGLGAIGETASRTYQSATHEWEELKASWTNPPHGPIKIIVKELAAAHDVLRNTACVLGAGGYNALEVDAAVFQSKISDGIVMLTTPMEKMIDEGRARIKELEAEVVRLKGLVANEFVEGFEVSSEPVPFKEVTVVGLGYKYTLKNEDGDVFIEDIFHGGRFNRTGKVYLLSERLKTLFKEQMREEATDAQ